MEKLNWMGQATNQRSLPSIKADSKGTTTMITEENGAVEEEIGTCF